MKTLRTGRNTSGLILQFAALSLVALLLISACGSSSSAEEDAPSNVGLSISSGPFTSTIRLDGVTTVPFSETVIVEATFEEPVYGSAGQTSVFAQASPSTYRIGSQPPRNERTFTFTLSNRTPGLVEISIFANKSAKPIVFSVQIGEE
jgi:hypothetical protein